MSLTYLYKKLENMDSREQYCYIQNIFKRFEIDPIIPIDEIFKDIDGKQSSGKNPLGYLVMHLNETGLDELVPKYLRQLCEYDTFSDLIDSKILDIICHTMFYIETKDKEYKEELNYNVSDMLSVFEFGVGKYSEWSFLKLNPYTLVPALFRHLYKHYFISKTDEESGLPHIAHAACNLRMIELILEKSWHIN